MIRRCARAAIAAVRAPPRRLGWLGPAQPKQGQDRSARDPSGCQVRRARRGTRGARPNAPDSLEQVHGSDLHKDRRRRGSAHGGREGASGRRHGGRPSLYPQQPFLGWARRAERCGGPGRRATALLCCSAAMRGRKEDVQGGQIRPCAAEVAARAGKPRPCWTSWPRSCARSARTTVRRRSRCRPPPEVLEAELCWPTGALGKLKAGRAGKFEQMLANRCQVVLAADRQHATLNAILHEISQTPLSSTFSGPRPTKLALMSPAISRTSARTRAGASWSASAAAGGSWISETGYKQLVSRHCLFLARGSLAVEVHQSFISNCLIPVNEQTGGSRPTILQTDRTGAGMAPGCCCRAGLDGGSPGTAGEGN